MLKVLIIQRYYNLSGEETEFQILDCFSFQRFVGLSVGDAVPDKNSISISETKEQKISGFPS
jgi:IS5 family transposase